MIPVPSTGRISGSKRALSISNKKRNKRRTDYFPHSPKDELELPTTGKDEAKSDLSPRHELPLAKARFSLGSPTIHLPTLPILKQNLPYLPPLFLDSISFSRLPLSKGSNPIRMNALNHERRNKLTSPRRDVFPLLRTRLESLCAPRTIIVWTEMLFLYVLTN